MLELDALDLEEIATALADRDSDERRWLLDPRTGDVVLWTAETGVDGEHPVDLDALDLVVIDPLPSWVWFRDMADFADRVSDERAGRRLARALDGRGAFRRFRAELYEEHPELLASWFAFRDARATRRAVEWLDDNGLVPRRQVEAFFDAHPDPPVP